MKKNLFWSLLTLLFATVTFTACNDDDTLSFNDEGTTIQLPSSRVFILNEGSYQGNNSNLSFYAPNGEIEPIADLYKKQNNASLGDTGQDLIVFNNEMYLSVNGSMYLQKLNSAGVIVKTVKFGEADGEPRQLAAKDGYIYISMYSGKVYKYDTQLNKVAEVKVDANPEGLAVNGNQLLCVNSGYGKGNTLSVIDLGTFTVSKTIEISSNPQKVLAVNGDAYVIHYDAYWNMVLEKVNLSSGECTEIGNASMMREYNGTLYLESNAIDYSSYPYKTIKTFSTYNPQTGKLNSASFLKNAPEAVTATNFLSVYCMDINPQNGDIYVGLSDYSSTGDVYRFKADGTFVENIPSGGISPSHIVFM